MAYHQPPFATYLAKRVEYDTNGGCWLWTRARNALGYGWARDPLTNRNQLVHRLAYRHFVGEPGELCVLHKCDVPACCNPAHLFLGTVADNNLDKQKKGRASNKLTVADVFEIRRLASLRMKKKDIAALFGISQTNASVIANGNSWAWLSEDEVA